MDASQNHRLLNAVISNRFKQKPATMNILFNHCGPNFETSPCPFFNMVISGHHTAHTFAEHPQRKDEPGPVVDHAVDH